MTKRKPGQPHAGWKRAARERHSRSTAAGKQAAMAMVELLRHPEWAPAPASPAVMAALERRGFVTRRPADSYVSAILWRLTMTGRAAASRIASRPISSGDAGCAV